MARTSITVEEVLSHATEELTYTSGDATNDMQFVNTGREVLIVKGATTPTGTVTVKSVQDYNRRTGDLTQAVSASKEYWMGPFPPTLFNQSDGVVHVDLDDDTDISMTVVRML